ncbi:CMGC/DYRK/DYRK2 protein kinase [Cladophialophora psammophila CBS 110553]|uniref:CMGC/DYRK/DYRK2 protein kinase n=1 Tax=Cladophialophora psammophila CBS 110553 TaxID=1182543 RepID=W9VQF7_9EURO|nr:CMGC/DYRK/DYRK2 protein kinase [Cladophialophora psammophila CBS 110553]EXJ57793.1 CMGC/DYRK/DYRK2 protein kinase [Cladophialophora psammophila CBS 110553]
MPYRQNASATTQSGSARASNTRPDDVDSSGGTNLMQSHWMPAADGPQLTMRDNAVTVAGVDTLPSSKKQPPSSFPAASMTVSTATTKRDSGENATTTRRRQSSIPNAAKAPMGPRPLDYGSLGKRWASQFLSIATLKANTRLLCPRSASNSMTPQFKSVRGASAVASHDPYTNELSINDISRFSFASIQAKPPTRVERDGSLDFGDFLEPTFNFDDFQDTIVGTEPSLNHFPLPGRSTTVKAPPPSETSAPDQKKVVSQPTIPIPSRKGSGVVPVTRKSSTASNNSRNSVKSDSMATATTSILRGRRQSHFPPNSFNNANGAPKAPRKSVGPGTFVAPDNSERSTVRRRPSAGGRKSSTEGGKNLSLKHLSGRSEESGAEDTKTTSTTKSRASLAPKRQNSKDLLTPSRTPDPSRSTSTAAHHTPTRRSGTPGRTTTPGGNADRNRRISVMPHHATGLGARTVSPTDARRMKRMSIVPPAPPLPQSRISQAPPTPQPEPVPQLPQSDLQSPAIPNRKSLTPSSSRTTPDPNRKSYSSGQSLSSNTSYSSVRNTITNPARLPQAVNSSRLPTAKPRLDISTTTNYELEVPPVPAIPKAYESPGSELDQPFFSARSSSLPPFDGAISASPVVSTVADAMKALETPRASSNSSSPNSASQLQPPLVEPEPKPKPQLQQHPQSQQQAKANKKSLQTLRLPPLNLLPLSTPTSAKIRSLNTKSDSGEPPVTPPGIRNTMKTPSTPMTASKASFFSRGHKPADEGPTIRSSTSHHALRTDEMRPPSDISPSLPVFSFETDKARTISPFVSSSLPKSNDEFSNYMRPNFTNELNRNPSQPRPNGPRAPSFSVTPKAEAQVVPSPAEKQTESDSVFSATSLRRKLSRKRSESKLPEGVIQDDDLSKYDNMPPPKLPASANWTNTQAGAASPQRPSYLRSRRQTSTSSTHTGPERQESFDSTASNGRPSLEFGRTLMVNSNRSGVSTSTPHLVAHKPPPQRQQEQPLDRDDLIAEDEMKKLASKRKDFESAARELDNLRARARPATRMSHVTASRIFELNIFERGEIVDFPDIYFTGTLNARKIVGDLGSTSTNFGYDDERGDYNIVEGDHLAYRYEVVDLLGKGSFGQVVRCVDHKTGILVAVKIIRNKKRFHQQALVEVNILQKLKEWDPHKKHSVVNFDQSFYFRGHLCISTDLLGMNLYEFIKAHDFRGFSLKLIRRFTKQLLQCLVLLQHHKVIHCDLKPENILLAHPVHSEIKVIDFGSSCLEHEKVYTYIQSRFYRSPEVILGMSYGMPIDMWSVGCILAELYTGYPIFPGENEQEQLACIMEVFGPPEKHLIEKSSRKKLFFDSMGKPRLTVSSKGKRRRPSSKDLRQVLRCDDEAFLDFITKCLKWDPARRMTPHEANKHEFITGIKMSSSTARRNTQSAVNSPVKRGNSLTASVGARPLPQPPTTLKAPISNRQETSPNKAGPRRQSTMQGTFQGTSQAKRASHAAMNSSTSNPSLTRLTVGQRSMTNRSDLAAAAAAASLVK